MVRLPQHYREWLPAARDLSGCLLIVAACLALGYAEISLSTDARPSSVTAAFTAGFALAVLLLYGYRFWIGVFLGVLSGSLYADNTLGVALGIAAGNSFEALLGAALIRRFAGHHVHLDRVRDVTGLILLGAVLSTIVSPAINMPGVWEDAGLSATNPGSLWLKGWITDLVGVLVVTPLLLAYSAPYKHPRRAFYYVETAAIVLITAAVSAVVFGPALLFPHRYPLAFVLPPLIVWAAVRYEARGATLVTVLLACASVLGTTGGHGPFGHLPSGEGTLLLALFICVVAITGLLVAASNAERKQVGALRQGMEMLRQVLHLLPVGVWIADREGRITSANPAAERIWRGGTAYQGWGSTKKWTIEMHDWLRSRSTGAAETVVEEKIELLAVDGSRTMLLSSAMPLLDSGGRQIGAVAVHQDVTKMILAEQSLRELAAVVEQSDDIIIVTDRSGIIEYVNPGFEKSTGYLREEVIGRTPAVLKSGKHRQSFYANLWTTILAGKPFREVLLNRKKSGETYYEAKTISPIRDSAGEITHFASTGEDITQRMQAEEALRDYAGRLQQLSRRLIATEENERRQLARELHDRVGQNVTALSLNLHMLRGKLPPQSRQPVGAHLDDCEQLLDQTAQLIRDVMVELRPPGLDELGLAAALTEHARQVADRSGFAAIVRSAKTMPRLPPATEITLFRIAQEALTNVAKHARATEVNVLLETSPAAVVLSIADNGRGFDPADRAEQPRTSLGMVSMRERAESIGAKLRVESAPGQGTRVIVEAPGAAAAAAQPGLFE